MILLTDSISQSSNFCWIVLDETTYYISAFAVDSNGTIIDVQGGVITTNFEFNWKILDSTVCYYPFLENNSDKTGQTSLSNGGTKQTLGYRFSGSSSITLGGNKLSIFSSFRVKPNSLSSSGNALLGSTDKGHNGYNVAHSGNYINRAQFKDGGGTWYRSPTDLGVVGQWMHLGLGFNGTQAYVYKNGVKEVITNASTYSEDVYKALLYANGGSYNFDIAYFIADGVDREAEIVSAFNKTKSKFGF